MKITLNTRNLSITKVGMEECIIVPIGLNLNDNILYNIWYVLDEDFHGIKKDKPLVWRYQSMWIQEMKRRMNCLLILCKDNWDDVIIE